LYLNSKKKNAKVTIFSIDDPVKTDAGEINREVPDDSNDPQQKLEASENRKVIKQALDSLSPEHKSVLLLREIEGYSYEEIARITQSSLGTVKSRMNRARQALRNKITQMEHALTGSGGDHNESMRFYKY
jgi:RNA polymerase sigma-70 factor (ECF subfamily)